MNKMEETKSWYILFTAYRAEAKVKAQLDEAGIISYLPTVTSRLLWRNVRRKKEVPAIARCIFVYLGCDEFDKLAGISSLISFVDFSSCRLSEEQMQQVRLLSSESDKTTEWMPSILADCLFVSE